MFQFLHGADFHLDSPFSALPPELAAQRRRESRAMLGRMADYVNARGIRLVLLAGDLLDSGSIYRDTAEQLAAELGRMEALVCILLSFSGGTGGAGRMSPIRRNLCGTHP